MKNIDEHHTSCDSNNGERPIGCDANDGEHPAANDAALNERGGCLVAHGALEQGEHHSVDEHFMRLALEQSKQAFDLNEVPIGAVVVADDQVIAGPSFSCGVFSIRACSKKAWALAAFRLQRLCNT